MKKIIYLIALSAAMILFSCINGQDVFPNTVNVTKTDNLVRMKGSKLFAKVPDDYKPITSLVRYQKNDHTYFQVIEIPNTNFVEYKSKTSRQAMESQGAKVDAYETVKYNGFDGIYFEGPSKIQGQTKIGLAFGDESFATMILGVCLTADKNSKDELKSIFSNSFYDKSHQLNPLELANFLVDETITGFKYATTMGNILFYSPNGKADMKGLLDFSSYQIMPFEAGSFNKVKELLETINEGLTKQGVQVSNIRKKETTINGNSAYEITMDAKDINDKKASIYQVVIYKEGTTSAVLFMGTDSDNEIYLEKFKATAQSIKL